MRTAEIVQSNLFVHDCAAHAECDPALRSRLMRTRFGMSRFQSHLAERMPPQASSARFPFRPTPAFLLVLVLTLGTGCGKKEAPAAAAPPKVEVTSVVQQDVPIYTEFISTLDGYVNAQIQPQVTGYLMKQNYREGTVVSEGEVLFEIDPRPFEAALQQSKGQLAQAEAQLGKTKLDVARDTPLAKESAIPQAQLDNDIQANQAAEAMVAAAKAQVVQAQLNLGFTKVRSLIEGIAGISKAQIGDLVSPTSVLTTVSQVQPIKAYFAISEQEYLKLSKRISEVAEGGRLPSGQKTLELI